MTVWEADERQPVEPNADTSFTLPARAYTDPEVLEQERERIFSKYWKYVGGVSQVAEPGEFITTSIAGYEIMVLRGDDGEIRAFHNVCPHRGSKILGEDCGQTEKLQCPYHAWTFDFEGDLQLAPSMDDDLIDFEESGLQPVHVETWGPWIFVNVDPDPIPFSEQVGSLPERIEKYNLDSLNLLKSVEYELDANWKVVIDNALECYHCAPNHKSLINIFDMDDYSYEMFDYFSIQRGAIDENRTQYYLDDEEAIDVGPPGKRSRFQLFWPDFMINHFPGPDNAIVFRIEPVDHETTRNRFDFYLEGDEIGEEHEELIEWAMEIQEEDTDLISRNYEGLKTGAFQQGPISKEQEPAVIHFHSLLDEHLDLT